MNIRVEKQARDDIREAAGYYLKEGDVDVAVRFVDRVEETFGHIAEMPALGRLYKALSPRLSGLRTRHVKGFPYLIFYLTDETTISVLSLLHQRRNIPSVLWDRFGEEGQ